MSAAILQTKAEIEAERIPYSPLGENEASGASDSTPSIVISRERQPKARRQPEATASPYGMTPAELKRLSAACHYVRRQGAGLFVSTSCQGASEAEVAALVRSVRSDLAKYQRDAGIARFAIDVRQCTPGPHAHILSVWPTAKHRDEVIRRLRNSRYSEKIWVRDVYDWNGLVGYLATEATPQACYAAGRSIRRLPKHRRATPITGDNVRLSRPLERALIQRGDIEPYRHKYVARVSFEKPNETKGLLIDSDGSRTSNFNGLASFKSTPGEQLALFPDAPVIDFRAAAEARRKELGISQREAAKLAGIRQSHWSNAFVRRHDPVGPWVLNRVREFIGKSLAA